MALIALLGVFVTAFIGMGKFTRHEATQLETRLNSIENSIEILSNKVDPIWDAIMNEIPKLLIRESTPKLDVLLKLASNDLKDMTPTQIQDMIGLLDAEYEKAIESDNAGRAVGIALYRASLRGIFG